MRLACHMLPVGCAVGLIAASVYALPRFSLQNSTPCQTCHINPSGGGMRNEFGNHAVAFQELVLPPMKKLVEDRFKPPRLGESVTVGFDLRYLVFDDGEVFRMQTDAYAAIEPFRDFYYQLRLSDEQGITENFGLLYFDEQRHYIKVGRFELSHGLKLEDHTAYVRSRTGDQPHLYYDGLALGAKIGDGYAAVELFNPEDRGMIVVHAYRPGFIPQLNLGWMAGFSGRFSEKGGDSDDEPSDETDHSHDPAGPPPDNRAVFGGLSYDRFSLLGELDLAGRSPDQLAFCAGFTARIEHGLYFLTEYNFYDGDRDIAAGVDEFVRLSLQVFPLPYVELRPAYTWYTRGPLDGEDDFYLQLHLGY